MSVLKDPFKRRLLYEALLQDKVRVMLVPNHKEEIPKRTKAHIFDGNKCYCGQKQMCVDEYETDIDLNKIDQFNIHQVISNPCLIAYGKEITKKKLKLIDKEILKLEMQYIALQQSDLAITDYIEYAQQNNHLLTEIELLKIKREKMYARKYLPRKRVQR